LPADFGCKGSVAMSENGDDGTKYLSRLNDESVTTGQSKKTRLFPLRVKG
jgi:hypothetical protein